MATSAQSWQCVLAHAERAVPKALLGVSQGSVMGVPAPGVLAPCLYGVPWGRSAGSAQPLFAVQTP